MTEVEAALARRLRKMRWIATGLLVAMAILFVVASLLVTSYPGLGVVVAFAEAGMIGALADWFAVTALFRRPLNLPIPHTAIVPSRKNEIGQALARFIRDHFLTTDAILPRVTQTDLAGKLGVWLSQEKNANQVSKDLATAADWFITAVDTAELRNSLRASLHRALQQTSVSAGLSVILDVFTTGDHAQALIDQLVEVGRAQLGANEEQIRERIKARSPWWLPKFVDEEIFSQLVGELQRILDEIGADPKHAARADFSKRLRELQSLLNNDPVVIERAEVLRDEFLSHPAVQAYVDELWQRVRRYVASELNNPDSAIRTGVERELRIIAQRLEGDTEVNERLNSWLRNVVTYLVETYRQQLSEIVSDTIDLWDPTATSERIELYIGRDLQFIRINGTLVGGLVGVTIYFIASALSL
jgi:uncharacterized membrane-anchored protein YjiN (DUF445 family)